MAHMLKRKCLGRKLITPEENNVPLNLMDDRNYKDKYGV